MPTDEHIGGPIMFHKLSKTFFVSAALLTTTSLTAFAGGMRRKPLVKLPL
ncbi:hypothetical protein [Cognatishimia activa]|uniref:Uncharacterized protein n=1 Tax=Cognatishimia activa TaxID=1715691 RepID=A0A0P1IS64_9RHOB|nr:hypothetical protein [Cognatishimia activa]CUI61570.1 hypothetical protein TA5113_00940 [Cognatishimia activa]CUK26303.1 hypothetical protein TA5114_02112 [Cognatishimia activa]